MIETLVIDGLGPFRKKRKFTFKPGVNVILGKNGSGKTIMAWIMNCLLSGEVVQRRIGLDIPGKRKGFAELRHSGGSASLSITMDDQSREMNYKSSGRTGAYLFSAYEAKREAAQVAKDVIETVRQKGNSWGEIQTCIIDDIDDLDPATQKKLYGAFEDQTCQLIATSHSLHSGTKIANLIGL